MPEDGELAFSLYELRKVLGWSDDSGGTYRKIKDALVRIQLTGVQSTNAFYSAADERLIADSFNVWSVHHVVLNETSLPFDRKTFDLLCTLEDVCQVYAAILGHRGCASLRMRRRSSQ